MCPFPLGRTVRPPAVSITHPRPPAGSNSNPSPLEVQVEGIAFISVEPVMFEDIDEIIRVDMRAGQEVLAGQGVIEVVGVMAVEAIGVEVVQGDNL